MAGLKKGSTGYRVLYDGGRILQKKNMEYIQNRTNWCWAVACRIVGEQYKRNHTEYSFEPVGVNTEACGGTRQYQGKTIATDDFEGLRMEIVESRNNVCFVDIWQHAIVENANSIYRGIGGNFPGDDMAKLRGLKYVVTGQIESGRIRTASVGKYDSEYSILHGYHRQLKEVFEKNRYLIGNAVLSPQMISHSFVLLDWGEDDEVTVYDPWDGNVQQYTVWDVFLRGFRSARGTGIVKWAQYIM
ncbi:MAG: hypothetical protein K2P64_08540 [Lachnospiraceae bacterium]|nr:hypothetical protein [Lachnospiraceae bacterium]